jgi:hypothetical protein
MTGADVKGWGLVNRGAGDEEEHPPFMSVPVMRTAFHRALSLRHFLR